MKKNCASDASNMKFDVFYHVKCFKTTLVIKLQKVEESTEGKRDL